MSKQAWVTLATNDSYALGALVLAHSIRRVNSAYPAVVLITPSVSDNMRARLNSVFAEVVTVDVLDSGDAAHLALLARPELGITFTKIHCWALTQYDKCVFLDADTLVVQNSDDLFEREELSAAPDVGWPDCFNSGVFVFRPSEATFDSLLQFAKERGSFDGGDQGLLNSYFSTWAHGDMDKHLPFLYNVTSFAFYSYVPALKEFGEGLKIVHFIGNAKPWLQQFNWESRTVDALAHLQPSLQLWWDIFVDDVHSQLDEAMTGLAGTLARLSLGSVSGQRAALDEHTRRQGWEAGNIDYMGADAFDNIWAKISETLAGSQTEVASAPLQEPTPIQAPVSFPPSGEVPPSLTATPVGIDAVESPAPQTPAPKPSAATTESPAPVAAELPAPTVSASVEAPVEPAEVPTGVEVAAPAPESAPEPTKLEATNAEPATPTPAPVKSESVVDAPVELASAHGETVMPIPIELTAPTPVIKSPPAPTPDGSTTPTSPEPTPAPAESTTPTAAEPVTAPVVPITPTSAESTPVSVEPPISTSSPLEQTTPIPVESTPTPVEPTPTPVESTPTFVESTPTPVESTPPPVEAPKAEILPAAAAESKVESSPIVAAALATPERAPQSTSTDSPPLVSTPDKDAVSPKSNEEGAQETRL